MSQHLLACALFCNPDGTTNGLGTGVAWLIGILLGLALLLWVVGAIARGVENAGRRKRGLPPEPLTGLSPGTLSLLSGRNVVAYTAPVSAVTPGGVRVRQARCCARGHQSPAQAVAHASAIQQRIGTAGR